MNRSLAAFLAIILLFSTSHSREGEDGKVSVGSFALGMSIGTGYGLDGSIGKHTFKEGMQVFGWDVIGSAYLPYWGKKDPPGTQVDVPFSWWNKAGVAERRAGVGLGFKITLHDVGFGVLVDFVRTESWQRWISSASMTEWSTPLPEKWENDITGHLSLKIALQYDLTLFIGGTRGVMGGVFYRFY